MDMLREKAYKLGASDFGASNQKYKKYYVVYNGRKIHFGDNRYEDYTKHGDSSRRKNYLARASQIRNKAGNLTANDKNSANFWAINLLW